MEAHETPPMQEGRRRLSVAHLLTALVVMFALSPIADSFAFGSLLESAIFTIVSLTAVGAVGGRRRTWVAAAALAIPALAARWLSHAWPAVVPVDIGLVLSAVFVLFVVAHLFRFVIVATVINGEVLCASIAVYLLFAILWSLLYTLLARWDPNAFSFTVPRDALATMSGFMSLYYSIQILTTLAFGDILPVSNLARMMAIVEAGVGIFYLAILVARLVGLYSTEPPSEAGKT
jgi:hypothetical protein